ncbi:U3 small nucleolar RNA-associated protein, putative [Entamoeba invadens IP1]|uniref:U3 small nucleolar RNA-associated protein, putative n=1 Tax=Entamoeba invadens IP1 TaxID=370355 RepID=A0A0A1U265_ENTIV|nr:U3 small nucleolar RNA-associated protein, putative [Entamoeba invadens IP1]ELP85598.1 U3 small nucleolar RNA-associated protein, putative [Entamoeba invadens IP1]|eukprot:XP_004184944.1 U3 small nucleolar RNA-associated protein, putative [Entamoeba invadens IP1]
MDKDEIQTSHILKENAINEKQQRTIYNFKKSSALNQTLNHIAQKETAYKLDHSSKRTLTNYLQPKETEKIAPMKYDIADVMPYLDRQTKAKVITLSLASGPYMTRFTGNGSHLGICGKYGHIGVMKWKQQELVSEFVASEQCNDFTFLHTFHMYAVSQKYLHIYDDSTTNLHTLKQFYNPKYLQFLPYHFLLAIDSIRDQQPVLSWLDVSIGEIVAQRYPKSIVTSMVQNPYNAVIIEGHRSGALTMWTPNMEEPIVAYATGSEPITKLASTRDGRRLAMTIGNDVRFFETRMLKENTSLRIPCDEVVNRVAYSQRGLLAMSHGSVVDVYNENLQLVVSQRPCLSPSDMVADIAFCPFEDFLAVGRYKGVSTLPIPGSGSSAFDIREQNIYEGERAFTEREVRNLLEKIPADMITMTPDIVGKMRTDKEKNLMEDMFVNEMRTELEQESKLQKDLHVQKVKGETRPKSMKEKILIKRLKKFETIKNERKLLEKPTQQLRMYRDPRAPQKPVEQSSALDIFGKRQKQADFVQQLKVKAAKESSSKPLSLDNTKH